VRSRSLRASSLIAASLQARSSARLMAHHCAQTATAASAASIITAMVLLMVSVKNGLETSLTPARFHAIVVRPKVFSADKIRLNRAAARIAVIALRVAPSCRGDGHKRDSVTLADCEVFALGESAGIRAGDFVGRRHILVSSGFAFDMRSKACRLRGRNTYFCIGANFFSAQISAWYVLTLGVCPRSKMRQSVVWLTSAALAQSWMLTSCLARRSRIARSSRLKSCMGGP